MEPIFTFAVHSDGNIKRMGQVVFYDADGTSAKTTDLNAEQTLRLLNLLASHVAPIVGDAAFDTRNEFKPEVA